MKKCLLLAISLFMLAACSSKEERLFQQAQLATDKGDLPKAVRLYTTLLKQDPDNIAAHTNRGILFERLPAKTRVYRHYKN